MSAFQIPADPTDPTVIRDMLDAAALEYDIERHGLLEPVAKYRTAAGEQHYVCINLHPELDWRVIDVAQDGSATFVGRLEGIDDVRPQARAYARDYAEQSRQFHAGTREDPPILRPKPMRVTPRARLLQPASPTRSITLRRNPAAQARRPAARAHAAMS